MPKTTKKQFRDFIKSFKKWQMILNCNDYDMTFVCRDLGNGVWADIDVNIDNSFATAGLTSFWSPTEGLEFDPRGLAKHECIHLFLMRLMEMASNRYCSEKELTSENERIVRMLERLIKNDIDISKFREIESC